MLDPASDSSNSYHCRALYFCLSQYVVIHYQISIQGAAAACVYLGLHGCCILNMLGRHVGSCFRLIEFLPLPCLVLVFVTIRSYSLPDLYSGGSCRVCLPRAPRLLHTEHARPPCWILLQTHRIPTTAVPCFRARRSSDLFITRSLFRGQLPRVSTSGSTAAAY